GIGRNGFLHVSDVDPAYYRHLESGGEGRGDRWGDRRGRGDRGRGRGERGERRSDRGERRPERPRAEPIHDYEDTPREEMSAIQQSESEREFGAGLFLDDAISPPEEHLETPAKEHVEPAEAEPAEETPARPRRRRGRRRRRGEPKGDAAESAAPEPAQ